MRGFFRFNSVSIPDGATITSAKLQFKSNETLSGSCSLIVHFEDADDPTAPTSVSDNEGRALTSGVSWNSVASWTNGTWYDSPELKTILQAVIDRAGYVENKAITAHVLDNGGTDLRNIRAYDSAAGDAAKLIVTYTT
jgi:hypothetical protein